MDGNDLNLENASSLYSQVGTDVSMRTNSINRCLQINIDEFSSLLMARVKMIRVKRGLNLRTAYEIIGVCWQLLCEMQIIY